MFNSVFAKNHSVYEIMWENNVEPDRRQTTVHTIGHMRFVRWETKATKHKQNM